MHYPYMRPVRTDIKNTPIRTACTYGPYVLMHFSTPVRIRAVKTACMYGYCVSACICCRDALSAFPFRLHIRCIGTFCCGSVLLRRQWNTLCISCFVVVAMFSHAGLYAAWRWRCRRGGRSGHRVVINIQRIPQVVPHLTLSSYTTAANCAPGPLAMTTCVALPVVGDLQRAV